MFRIGIHEFADFSKVFDECEGFSIGWYRELVTVKYRPKEKIQRVETRIRRAKERSIELVYMKRLEEHHSCWTHKQDEKGWKCGDDINAIKVSTLARVLHKELLLIIQDQPSKPGVDLVVTI